MNKQERNERLELYGRGFDLLAAALADFDTPEEVRVAYSILKSADILPEEAELLKEVAALKEELDNCTGEAQRKKICQAIEDRLLKYRLLVERAKK